MKSFIFVLTALFVSSSYAGFCDDPIRSEKICYEMKNLRSHIMLVEAQRDLLRVNYSYMRIVSDSLGRVADSAAKTLPEELKDHAAALKEISISAAEMSELAAANNPEVLVSSNNLRTQCASCHASQSASSGYNWKDIFNTDWTKIVERCNAPGRNPLVCKQMHGMISNFSYISSAYFAGTTDYEMLAKTSGEIARISTYLLANNLVHNMSADSLGIVNAAAMDAEDAAMTRNPDALSKAFHITDSCMECHSSQSKISNKLSISPF